MVGVSAAGDFSPIDTQSQLDVRGTNFDPLSSSTQYPPNREKISEDESDDEPAQNLNLRSDSPDMFAGHHDLDESTQFISGSPLVPTKTSLVPAKGKNRYIIYM